MLLAFSWKIPPTPRKHNLPTGETGECCCRADRIAEDPPGGPQACKPGAVPRHGRVPDRRLLEGEPADVRSEGVCRGVPRVQPRPGLHHGRAGSGLPRVAGKGRTETLLLVP